MSGVDSTGISKLEFQVIVRILEARNLVGLDIDPYIEVSIRDQKKRTKAKYSTNSAVFDEVQLYYLFFVKSISKISGVIKDFTFHFSLPQVLFQQQIITIEAISDSRFSLLRSASTIGSFKIDIATINSQHDSSFIHKWALLLDFDDPLSGPKGYVKCDLIICKPGIIPKIPVTISKNDEDIEGNLLIPEDFSKNNERQPARYFVTIFEAKDLPLKANGVMASMKKAFVGDTPKVLVDSFVQVSFAGKSGKTSVKKNCANPKWYEEIVFYEMFPSLVKIIKIRVKDESQSVIATTFLDFTLIADNSTNGFLPTFGPAWLNLYGNYRDNSEESLLNCGVGEGLAYRGSVKLSLHVQLLDDFPKKGLNSVEIRNVQQNQVDMMPLERLLLFCTIFETDMIDKKYAGKQTHFEMSFGKEGCNEDIKEDSWKSQKLSEIQPEKGLWKTPPSVVVSLDRQFCSIPTCATKPCMHLFMDIDESRKRLNMINRMKNFSSDIVIFVQKVLIRKKYSKMLQQNVIKETMSYSMNDLDAYIIRDYFMISTKRFIDNCRYVISLLESEYIPVDVATFLDLEKQRQRKRELVDIIKTLTEFKKRIESASPEDFVKLLEKCLTKLNLLGTEPQECLPDVYIWLVCNNKKVAYKRIKPEDILYSTDENERGQLCSKVQSFFLKTPYANDKENQLLCYQVKAYFWLGAVNEKHFCMNNLPPTFNPEMVGDYIMPHSITYKEFNEFELRCHIFQGRSLIGSDDSGLSDPFVRVSFNGQCQQSQVIEQTLCPIWDECLVFPKIILYGSRYYIKNNPPFVTVQVYDFDKLGENEFLGQCEILCTVKLDSDSYSKPSLECCKLIRNSIDAGEILAVCELIQVEDNVQSYPDLETSGRNRSGSVKIPSNIKPVLSDYRLEVLFWGLRDLKTSSLFPIDQPKVQIDWGNGFLESESVLSSSQNANFKTLVKSIQIKLPDDFNYQPPITIRCVDSRAFGRNVLIGTCTVNNIGRYILQHPDELCVTDRNQKVACCSVDLSNNLIPQVTGKTEIVTEYEHQSPFKDKEADYVSYDWWSKYYASHDKTYQKQKNTKKEKKMDQPTSSLYQKAFNISTETLKKFGKQLSKADLFFKSSENKEDSKEEKSKKYSKKLNTATFQIYDRELETVPEFNGFRDCFEVFNLYRGKKLSGEMDDSSRNVGKFKGHICLQRISNEQQPVTIPRHLNNEHIKVAVRIYIIKALNLRPSDPSGKADPYLNIILGKTKICDKANKIVSQLNPIFGKLFEIEANFPEESELLIQVFDWDRLTSDDLMGETKIDLEQRYYSKHRARCGLPLKYESTGYNAWRDALKPTQILSKLCKQYSLTGPTYTNSSVTVNDTIFTIPNQLSEDTTMIVDKENLALACIHQLKQLPQFGFNFVPEHIETRTLYLPEKPGIEQGELELWIDMFPMIGHALPLPTNITPRKANSYELRIIIWDTKNIILDDYNAVTGISSVDQYIKCHLIGSDVDGQQTDVHYRSLNGDGNFNWRFIFKFDFMEAERKIVHRTKESLFSLAETEEKLPPKLNLQVWDADVISSDDFLGNLSLNLTKLPRGAKSAKICTLDLLKPKKQMKLKSYLNLFEVKRTRGWYPFVRQEKHGVPQLAGKVDIEFHLVSAEDAEKKPAGHGRDGPDPTPSPHRPETSIAWFTSPFKVLQYDLWIGMRWKLCQLFCILLLVLLLCVFIYTLPEALAQKLVQTYV